MEDQTSPAQLRESFRGIAGDKASAFTSCAPQPLSDISNRRSHTLLNSTCALHTYLRLRSSSSDKRCPRPPTVSENLSTTMSGGWMKSSSRMGSEMYTALLRAFTYANVMFRRIRSGSALLSRIITCFGFLYLWPFIDTPLHHGRSPFTINHRIVYLLSLLYVHRITDA